MWSASEEFVGFEQPMANRSAAAARKNGALCAVPDFVGNGNFIESPFFCRSVTDNVPYSTSFLSPSRIWAGQLIMVLITIPS